MVVLFSAAFTYNMTSCVPQLWVSIKQENNLNWETTLAASNFDFPTFMAFVLQSIQRTDDLDKVVMCLINAHCNTVTGPSPMAEQTTSKPPLTNIPPVCPYGRPSPLPHDFCVMTASIIAC